MSNSHTRTSHSHRKIHALVNSRIVEREEVEKGPTFYKKYKIFDRKFQNFCTEIEILNRNL